jgi:hypothetical protein
LLAPKEFQRAMSLPLIAVLTAVFVIVGTLTFLELGIRTGHRRRLQGLEPGGGGAIEGAVFAIFGLLVAFTFSGAASRFDERRALVTQEANDIGTAWLRLDLLPAMHQPVIRDDMRRYLDERLAAYSALPDFAAARKHQEAANALQGTIWKNAVTACRADASPATTSIVLPALNAMFDIATTRVRAAYIHPPAVIYVLLVVMALVCAFVAGTGLATSDKPNRIHAIGFAFITGLVVYLIIDLEFPRLGFIRVDAADQVLIELRASMGPISAP